MRKAKVVWHRDDDAVSPVIGTILMVAITVVLAAVLWLMVSGMLSTEDDNNIAVQLKDPSVKQFTRGGTTVWDAYITVQDVTPSDEDVPWVELRIIVKDKTGTVLNQSTTPTADGGSYHNYTEFWFGETEAGGTQMSAGDTIKITGMSTAYEGATVELLKGTESIGYKTLPGKFP